jgi:hypothetical protein
LKDQRIAVVLLDIFSNGFPVFGDCAFPRVTIEWRSTGGGVTVEKFTVGDSSNAMSGVSNRYGPLTASKL